MRLTPALPGGGGGIFFNAALDDPGGGGGGAFLNPDPVEAVDALVVSLESPLVVLLCLWAIRIAAI